MDTWNDVNVNGHIKLPCLFFACLNRAYIKRNYGILWFLYTVMVLIEHKWNHIIKCHGVLELLQSTIILQYFVDTFYGIAIFGANVMQLFGVLINICITMIFVSFHGIV